MNSIEFYAFIENCPAVDFKLEWRVNISFSIPFSLQQNRELQIMRKLDHCNIVRLRYFFYSSGEKVCNIIRFYFVSSPVAVRFTVFCVTKCNITMALITKLHLMLCSFRLPPPSLLFVVERWSVFEPGAGLRTRDRVQSCSPLQQGQDHHTHHLRQSTWEWPWTCSFNPHS